MWFYKIEENRCPKGSIEIFYDKENLKKYESRLGFVEKSLVEIVGYLYHHNNAMHLFIRVHGYKQWIVLRISGKICLPKEAKVICRELCGSDICNISMCGDDKIIKIALLL